MRYTFVYALILSLLLISFLTSAASVHQGRFVRPARRATSTKTTTSAVKTTTNVAVAAAAAAAPTSPAGSGTTYLGDGTWFDLGLGSCGQTNTDTELVAALNAPQMNNGANPNTNPMCGKQIKVTNPANGKSVTVKIVS